MEIIQNFDMPVQVRASKGNRFFTAEVSALAEQLEVGQGFIVPWQDATDEGKKLMRRSIVFWGNKLAEKFGRQFVYGNLENGIGIKRVG